MKANTRKKAIGVLAVALFVSFAFVGSMAWAGAKEPGTDWSEKELMEFSKKPWTQEELNKMGNKPRFILNKEIEKRFEGSNLTPEQLYRNGQRYHRAIMFQYGVGISAKDFYKAWIEQEGYKDPKVKLLDLRMESEFAQARVPGATRLDTGLSYWQLPGKASDPTMTYYLMCKGGDPKNGGSRGAFVKKAMLQMGYTGKIYNITDGFRGYIENGYPVVNDHGMFTLIPGTFQIAEKDATAKSKEVVPIVAPTIVGLAPALGVKDY
ncbi:MAG: rhodanese-like domain-containing protein [Syntrophobacteraceae bacterium]